MSSSPPSSKIQTPPSSTGAGFRSTRSRVPVKRAGYVDSSEIEDPDNISDEEMDDDSDGDFEDERKGKRSRSSEDDEVEEEEEDSQVCLISSCLL